MTYGYVRISTVGQKQGNSIEEQTKAILSRYPDCEIIVEVCSGAKERPIFNELLSKCKKDDIIVVTKLDRFCRTTKEGLEYIDDLRKKGVNIHILNMGLIEDTPMGKLIVTTLLAIAEFERDIIVERTQNGKAIARTKPGFKDGRPEIEVPNFERVFKKTQEGKLSVKEAISKLGISRSKWYRLCQRA